MMIKNRGGLNIDYKEGFEKEAISFDKYKGVFKRVLNANEIEATTRGIIDMITGTDAMALIQGDVFGVSLRVRTSDFATFTLNRHIDNFSSEVHKWSKARDFSIKPAYHIQLAERDDGRVRVIKINIDAFGVWLRILDKNGSLQNYYNEQLLAYEFSLGDVEHLECVFTEIYTID